MIIAARDSAARIVLATVLLAANLALCAPAVSAEPLGRLFLTPERRAALERQRMLNIRDQESQLIEGATLSVSGVVQRSSGRNTAWINGVPQQENTSASGVRVEIDKSQPASTTVVAGEEAPAKLKVGESVNRTTREKTSGVEGGTIVVPSSASTGQRRTR